MSSIEPFIYRKIVVLNEDRPVLEAARAMCDQNIGCIIASNHTGKITGMLTDRDLVCGLLAYGNGSSTPISEVMTGEPLTVEKTATLDEVVQLMESNGIRRIPVIEKVGQHERCLGVITLDDLIASQTVDFERISRIVKSQVSARPRVDYEHGRSERAEERSQAHADQTLHKFYRVFIERLELPEAEVARVTRFLLGNIIRRLHYTGAANLIAQLPHHLQDELLDLTAGPDRSITLSKILDGLIAEFKMDEQRAQATLARFCRALSEVVSRPELEHIKSQLPQDMQPLFDFKGSQSAA